MMARHPVSHVCPLIGLQCHIGRLPPRSSLGSSPHASAAPCVVLHALLATLQINGENGHPFMDSRTPYSSTNGRNEKSDQSYFHADCWMICSRSLLCTPRTRSGRRSGNKQERNATALGRCRGISASCSSDQVWTTTLILSGFLVSEPLTVSNSSQRWRK